MRALEDWGRVCGAMDLLGISPQEEDSFWLLLAAITNLGFLATHLGQNINIISAVTGSKFFSLFTYEQRARVNLETINILHTLQ